MLVKKNYQFMKADNEPRILFSLISAHTACRQLKLEAALMNRACRWLLMPPPTMLKQPLLRQVFLIINLGFTALSVV